MDANDHAAELLRELINRTAITGIHDAEFTRIRKAFQRCYADAHAAGFAEAIEKAAKVAEDPNLPGYYRSGHCDADCSSAISEGIRTLVKT